MGVDRSPPKPPVHPAGGRSKGGSSNIEKQSLKDLGGTYSVSVALGGGGDGADECGVCKGVVKEGQNGIECDVCEVWLHADCEGMKKRDYDYFAGKSSALYVCKRCKGEVKGAKGKIEKLTNENDELRRENEKIMKMMGDIVEEMREMKGVIKRELKEELMVEMEKIRGNVVAVAGMQEGNIQQQVSMVTDLKKEVLNTVKEEDEKRKRECNVVVHGLRKTESSDRNKFETIMREVLELEDVRVEEINRLGKGEKERNSKPVSVLVKFETPGQKWAVVSRAKKLRYAGEEYRRVMIVPDLTVRERMEDKKLREELRRRRDAGENDIYISRGKIVKRSRDGNNNSDESRVVGDAVA